MTGAEKFVYGVIGIGVASIWLGFKIVWDSGVKDSYYSEKMQEKRDKFAKARLDELKNKSRVEKGPLPNFVPPPTPLSEGRGHIEEAAVKPEPAPIARELESSEEVAVASGGGDLDFEAQKKAISDSLKSSRERLMKS